MRLYLSLIFVLTVCVVSTSYGQDTTADRPETTCEVFLSDVGAMGVMYEDMYLTWAIGQMELRNKISKEHGMVQRVIDPDIIDFDTQREFLLNFCEQNPEKEFVDGVLLLYDLFPETY